MVAFCVRSCTFVASSAHLATLETAMATITQKFLASCALKVAVPTVSSLTRVVIDLGYGEFIDDIVEFHSAEVNPNV